MGILKRKDYKRPVLKHMGRKPEMDWKESLLTRPTTSKLAEQLEKTGRLPGSVNLRKSKGEWVLADAKTPPSQTRTVVLSIEEVNVIRGIVAMKNAKKKKMD